MKILVTGAAGFIGNAVAKKLLESNHLIVGLDNINSYYEPSLKFGRLATLGIAENSVSWNKFTDSSIYDNFRFLRMNIEDESSLLQLMDNEKFDIVIHLAAQAGVRYSIENPHTYVESNIKGFLNILEGCRKSKVNHLVYASSSSVYGLNGKTPFSEKDPIAHPVSLYAATKKSNELMAHAYSQLYNIPTTGLRFFTVYGPWGRPDMSPFLFIDSILRDKPIKVFNNGEMLRDFTYIDDIVEGVVRIIHHVPVGNPQWEDMHPDPSSSLAPYKIYNIGNQEPVRLLDYITCIEDSIGRTAVKQYLPMQPGDVYQTYADSSALGHTVGFKPNTPLKEGIKKTVEWFKTYYGL